MKKKLKVIFSGGGSGGHTMPALAMIERLTAYCADNTIEFSLLYVGSYKGIEKNIITRENIPYTGISTGKLRRYFSLRNLTDVFRILKGVLDSIRILRNYKPDVLVSTGGFVSVPPVIAAKLHKVPVVIHEQTINAGLANKIAARFADKVALTFPESKRFFPPAKTVMTGIPLRQTIFSGNATETLNALNLDPALPVVYFTGGGLGCHIINEAGHEILPLLLEKYNVIFQTGRLKDDYDKLAVLKESLPDAVKNRFVLYDFIHDELPGIFAATSLAVARSGAGTVNEFKALKIPAIFIPLAIATQNEQYKNALSMVDIGGALIIEEKDFNSRLLLETINSILLTEKLETMKEGLSQHNSTNGSDNMIRLIMELGKCNN